jgi:hypothetical protein
MAENAIRPGFTDRKLRDSALLTPLPVDCILLRRCRKRFSLKGGTMRTARKPRGVKHVSSAKSEVTSFFTAIEAGQESNMARTHAVRNDWIATRGISRVPTHAVTVPNERRAYARAQLQLPLRIVRIAGRREEMSDPVFTTDISSSGLRARCPFEIALGTPVHLEVELVRRPEGRGSVRLITQAQVVRVQPDTNGWHTLAFSFDDITFERDDLLAPQFAHS